MVRPDPQLPGDDARVPEDVFAEFVALSETDEGTDFEDWVRVHPRLEADLRELHRSWVDVQSDIRRALPRGNSFFYRFDQVTPPGSDVAQRLEDLGPGKCIGDFRLVRLLGQGGQGQVWEAEQTTLERRVAIKLMRPERLNVKNILFFEREGRAGGRLSHPGIVAVYSAGEVDGVRYIAEELVEGGWRLVDFLDDMRKLPELPQEYYRKIASLFAEIADALHAAHRAGVTHRDVKPHNILITPDERPKITDFGMARLSDERSLSRSGDVAGTYQYMSPEQVSGKRVDSDHRTDVFSLGVVLYEAMTLTRPFDGDTTQQVAHKILFEDPPEPSKIRSRVPRELAILCGRALEKNPKDRYASMEELAAELRRWLRGESILASPPGPLKRAARWARRHPTASAVMALSSVALVIISLVLAESMRARRAADELTLDVMRLSTLRDLRQLERDADELWPAGPRTIEGYRAWLADARGLEGSLPEHRTKLEELRAMPLPWSRETRWWHDQLASLVGGLERLLDPETGLVQGVSPEHGIGVEARLRFAEQVQRDSIDDPRASALWNDAITSIATLPHYGGLELTPQIGLLPIGRDPRSGLWEFAHLQTGDVPERDEETGELHLVESSGIVFVLLPGGTFMMGAQKDDEAGPNYDPLAMPREGPPHEVSVEPFFLAKHEMTQAQWVPSTGVNPSHFEVGLTKRGKTLTGRSPVENVDWNEANLVLQRLGLMLPSEAQWEYAARAGTDTPWSTGAEPASLAGSANTADAYCKQNGGSDDWAYDPWSDGWAAHATVGSYRPNPFGLHDMHGNLWEWCADIYQYYEGSRPEEETETRVLRGGSFAYPSADARSSVRLHYAPFYINDMLGLRPARAITRDSRTDG